MTEKLLGVLKVPLYVGDARTGHAALINVFQNLVQVRLPGGLVQFERVRFLRVLATNSWSRYVEFHEDLPEQALTWDLFYALKKDGLLGRNSSLGRKEAA